MTTAIAGESGAALHLRTLVKRYEGVAVVKGISLDISPGEFVTLLGPSGSGKTTTLNMIAGFAHVDEGDVLMDEKPIADLPSHKRNLGVVFQHYALFPHMTVGENIAFPLKRRKVKKPEQEALVQSALSMVKLENLAERYPRQLSGGQQQRVALARALVFSPRVLLMDEPLGALDKKLREWLQLELKRLHSELGITFVYVTHDQEEALVLSDRIAVFNDGVIAQVGPAEELYEHPRTLFVAEFLGESNVFSGRFSRDGSGRRFVADDGFELRAPESEIDEQTPVAVVVRPERVRAALSGSEIADGENVVSGTVRQAIYLGAARRLEVQLDSGRVVLVREPAGQGADASEGDRLQLCWKAEHSTVVAAGPQVAGAPTVQPTA
jgi:putative spermidine/putrescine transport system ATP-binding protein